jgi:hypothetical protein
VADTNVTFAWTNMGIVRRESFKDMAPAPVEVKPPTPAEKLDAKLDAMIEASVDATLALRKAFPEGSRGDVQFKAYLANKHLVSIYRGVTATHTGRA